MVNIEVSDYVKARLEVIKEEEGHKSLDSVIRVLLLERMERREVGLTLSERKKGLGDSGGGGRDVKEIVKEAGGAIGGLI